MDLFQKSLFLDFPRQPRHQHCVVNRFEELLQIKADHRPLPRLYVLTPRFHSAACTTHTSEPGAVLRKVRLLNTLWIV